MQKQKKRTEIILLIHKMFLLLLLLFTAKFMSSGEELSQRKGSVHIRMCYEQKAVSGGTVTLYQVGEYKKENGSWQLQLSDGFAGCEMELTGWTENGEFSETIFYMENVAECASKLAAYASQSNLAGITETADEDGTAEFKNLSCGLYLLIQKIPPDGYEKMEPFLLSVPTKEEGKFVYEVTAYPKLEWKIEIPKETEAADETEQESSEENKENGSTENKLAEQEQNWLTLPQTGQLKWPVLLLAVGGILLIAFGKNMQRKK